MAYYADYINPLGGSVFWVGPSGYVAESGIGASDNNDGLSPQKPLVTIQAGLDKCTNGQGDTVMLLPGSWTITAALTPCLGAANAQIRFRCTGDDTYGINGWHVNDPTVY